MSINKGCKTILINSYEGSVFVECPNNTKKESVIEIARKYFQEKLSKPLTNLNNVEYLTESEQPSKFNMEEWEQEEYNRIETVTL